jgi:hypothetical protein
MPTPKNRSCQMVLDVEKLECAPVLVYQNSLFIKSLVFLKLQNDPGN